MDTHENMEKLNGNSKLTCLCVCNHQHVMESQLLCMRVNSSVYAVYVLYRVTHNESFDPFFVGF